MAMSSPSMLVFFAVLLGSVVEHACGMRGPTRAESMVEEVTSEEVDPCTKFRAKKRFGRESDDHVLSCQCPVDRIVPSKECDGYESFFVISEASDGCSCLSLVEVTERLKLPVAASALRFCEALAEQSYIEGNMEIAMNLHLKETSPELCQHALTGTITPREAKKAPFAKKASELSQHGNDTDEDGDQDRGYGFFSWLAAAWASPGRGDRGYGRMRPVKENATQTALWEDALARVCKDECTDLLKMLKKEAKHLAEDVKHDHTPFARTCAEHVVQHVEAEVLGCCGRSCGFDGRRCLLWPFFSPQEKVEWEVECCAEISILKNSSREFMCNSVLPDRLAKEASQYDLNEQAGADIGKVLIGQNSSLLWTKRGAQESALGKAAKAHGGEKVNMDFLTKHKKVGEEYLRLGYFRKQPLSQILNEPTSIMQVHSQGTCDFGEFKEKCPKHFVTNYMKTCQDSWMVAEEEEEGEDFEEQLKDFRLGNCSLNSPQYVAAPEECDKLANESSILVYFTHDHNNEKKPIACATLDKKQCVTAEEKQWWKKIQLTSVQEVMNGQEIKDYTHRVYYVRVKADSK